MFGQTTSLKARLTVATLAVSVLALWALGSIGSLHLHRDMETMLGHQQFTTVSFVAAEVENNVRSRFGALEMIAQAMPASLVELAFITNPEEEALLASDAYQRELALALAKGIGRYFSESAR